MNVRLTAVVAVDRRGCIGKDGRVPWRMPGDLRRFKQVTIGKPVIMGRKTWQSLGKPLVERTNVVVTRDPTFLADGGIVVNTLDDAVAAAARLGATEAMVIGGAAIYALALPRLDAAHVTVIDTTVDGCDARMPPLAPADWRIVHRERFPADDKNPHERVEVLIERGGRTPSVAPFPDWLLGG